MASDDVQLTDLALIQQFSLAVRSATAPRSEVIAALEADLAFLTRGARRRVVAAPTADPLDPPAAAPSPDPASAARVRRTTTPRAAVKAPTTPVVTQTVTSKPAAGRAPRA